MDEKKITIYIHTTCAAKKQNVFTYYDEHTQWSEYYLFQTCQQNGSISSAIASLNSPASTYPFPTSDISKQKDIGLHD